ncbi:MAG: hypothetical protein LBN39_02880 [Planctomycetaceae bacterium]|jgi:hypothetical protein|nr:hypothetical protein [Planctomycetaceae bacterium]
MFVCLYFLNFLSVCLFFVTLYRQKGQSRREACVVACLVFSAQVFFFTEGQSLFNLLKTPVPSAVLYAVSLCAFSIGTALITNRSARRNNSRLPRKREGKHYFYPVLITVLIFLPMLFVAVYYPPCTWDSMSYHLPRIDHWIQNGNVNHYPTAYPRQLYYQPFAEYLMLPAHLLSGTDLFDNLIQFAAAIGILIEIILLVRFFGGSQPVQTVAVLMVLTSPTVIFEIPTTQTDLIAAFYFLAFLYFGLKLTCRQAAWLNADAAAFALALGLSLITKVSVAVFELPFCVWFGLRLLKLYGKNVWKIYAALVLCFLIFNVPYYVRNYSLTGHIFGPEDIQKTMRNTRFGPDVMFSNAVRLVGMQMKVPLLDINAANLNFIKNLHDTLGMMWNDPTTTFYGDGDIPFEYDIEFHLDDYRSGNILLVLLFIIVCGTFSVRKIKPLFLPEQNSVRSEPENKDLTVMFWLVLLGFLLYAGLFRWQPFGTRLLLPDLLAGVPFLTIGLCRIVPLKRIQQLCPLLLFIAVVYTAYIVITWSFYDPLSASGSVVPDKDSKPVNGQQKVDFQFQGIELSAEYYTNDLKGLQRYWFERDYKYFRQAKTYMAEYMSIADRMTELNCTKIGLALDKKNDRWEYPLWALLRSRFAKTGRKFRVEWVVFPDELKQLRNYPPDFVPDIILTDLMPEEITNRYEIGEPIWKYETNSMILVPIKGRTKQ